MIRIVRKNPKAKAKRKNPSFYQYGYHITANKNLESILSKGFVRKPQVDSKYPRYSRDIADFIYDSQPPIYFLTTPSLEYLTPMFKNCFYNNTQNIDMLKVDISKFDQLPDLDYLLMDAKYKFTYDREYNPKINFSKKQGRMTPVKSSEIPNKLKKYLNDEWKIPVTDFKTNPKLTMDTIAITHTLCIANDISSDYIEDVIHLKGKDLYLQYDALRDEFVY